MLNNLYKILFLISCSQIILFGQYSYLVTQFSTEEGLSQSQVMAICQDKTGFLWIGTRKGINRFDGKVMVQYFKNDYSSFNDNAIRVMEITENNRLWVGTEMGLFAWDIASNGEIIQEHGPFLQTQMVHDITYLNNKVWVASQNGITVYTDSKTPTIDPLTKQLNYFNDYNCYMISSINDSLLIASTRKSNLFWVTTNGYITQLKGQAGETRNSLYDSTNEKILIAGSNGLGEVVNDSVKIGYYEKFGPIWDIDKTDFGYYLSTMQNGLILVDSNLSPVFNFNSLGVPRYIKAFFIDNNGTIWIGTDGSGLFRISQSQFQSFTTKQGLLDNVIWSVHADTFNDRVYVGTWAGLMIYENEELIPAEYNSKLSNLSINAIGIASDGNILIGNDYNVNIISKNGEVSSFMFQGNGSMIHSIKSDSKGRVWVGSEFHPNIARYHNGHWKRFDFGESINNRIVIVKDFEFTSDGDVWIISDKYAALQEGITWKSFYIDGNTIYDLEITSSDELLLGTDEGVWILSENEFIPYESKIPDRASVYFIKEDFDSNIWFGTDQGVYKEKDSQIIRFTTIDGLVGNETNARSVSVDKDGNVWMGTVNGISKYTGSEKTKNLLPISYFQNLVTSDTTVVLIDESQEIKLKSGSSFYKFHYGGIFLNQNKPLIYGTRLAGFNNEWSWSKNKEIVYGTLPHGEYEFQIQSNISDNQKSAITSIKIRIIEPVLERTWVIITIIFVLVGIFGISVYFIYNWKKKQKLTKIEIYFFREIFTVVLFGKYQKNTIIPSGKLRTFFELIVLHSIMENKGINLNKITKYFWESGTPAQFKNRRNVAITKIRSALMSKEIGSIITVKDKQYEFSVPKNLYYCDVQEFIENYYNGKSAEKMKNISDSVECFTKSVTLYGESGLLNEIDNPMIIDYSNRFLEMAKEASNSILHHKNIPIDERTINLCKKIRHMRLLELDELYD